MIGRTISHYRVTGQLGSGGMGVVYKAEDTRLDRTVALKFLAAHLLESEEHKQRFLREAKATASLDHPNICMVHEVGEADGHVFLAMGCVDGPELRAKIRERPLKLDEALDIAIQAAEGLRAAHQKGVVHRDIKSSNLMLTSTGQVKVMDFGLAQLSGGTRLTKTDTMLGTPAYMSPEQAQRLPTDSRTDIWSLGVVIYEMVTGRLPFEGEREAAVVHGIIREPHEPITALRVGVPTELDRIVGKALAKNPAQRYQHLDDMLVDLRTLRGSLSGGRVPAARAQSHRRWNWAALPLVLAAGGYLVWQASRGGGNEEPLRAVALTTLPGVERHPSFSPAGDHVAFGWNGPKQDNHDIYVQHIGSSGSPLRLTTDPLVDQMPVWSPDGRWIAFLRSSPGKSELRLVPPLGGPERKLAEVTIRELHNDSTYLAWCPENDCLLVTDSPGIGKPDALFAVSMESGEKKQLTNPQPPVYGDASPAVSHDGRELIFLRDVAPYSSEVFRLSLGKAGSALGEAKRILTGNTRPKFPAWSADDKEILFSDKGNLWRLPTSRSGRPSRIPFVGEDAIMPAVSRSGGASRLAYVRSRTDLNLWRVVTPAPGTPVTAAPSVAISSTVLDNNPQFSPDGRRVAFCSNRTGPLEIWLADPDGSNAVQLTNMGSTVTCAPRWSPDGQWITFDSDREGHQDINVIPAAGGKYRRLTSHPATDFIPSFSRNGQWIYFGSTRSGRAEIWRAPASGGEPVQVTRNGGFAAFESLDGTELYYLGGGSIWRMPVSGGQPVKILDGVVSVAFSVLETGIYYLDNVSGETRLQFYAFANGKSVVVARNLGPVFLGLAASPDGRTILYSRIDLSVDDLMLVEGFR
jgi:Tol biopolymer transport system component